jgi:hypothetical protein
MSKETYVDPTIAEHPPGGKVHKVENDSEAERLPTEKPGDADNKRGKKTATSPDTVANTEK